MTFSTHPPIIQLNITPTTIVFFSSITVADYIHVCGSWICYLAAKNIKDGASWLLNLAIDWNDVGQPINHKRSIHEGMIYQEAKYFLESKLMFMQ